MMVRPSEQGTALLTVLLLVAVMATVSATALDRIAIATSLTRNAAGAAQARAWIGMAERLGSVRIEDLLASGGGQVTLSGGWMGSERSIALPDGARVHASLHDGGNCFNLNSLVMPNGEGQLVARQSARDQFTGLMMVLDVPQAEAQRIAAATADYLDSDGLPEVNGSETNAANAAMSDPTELRAVDGVSSGHFGRLQRWICALPTTELSAINVNTLLSEQAPLLAMLAPGRLDLSRARATLSARPPDGFGSVINFWNSPTLRDLQLTSEVTSQVRVRTEFFRLETRVERDLQELTATTLLDARRAPVRIVHRQLGGA